MTPSCSRYLAAHDIALEVCPTSNLATRAVATLAEHPLPVLVAAGVPVTISSDDPSMFGTTLNNEYAVAADLLDLDEAGLVALARQAIMASFAEAALVRRQLLDEMEASSRSTGSQSPDVRRPCHRCGSAGST